MNFYYDKLHHVVSRMAVCMLLLMASHHAANAQNAVTGALEGFIRDADTNAPIPGATVRFMYQLNGVPTATRTDGGGRFYRGLLLPGTYLISIWAEHYQPFHSVQRVYAARTDSVQPLPVLLLPRERQARLQPTGSLAVASVPNATITVEPLGGGGSYKVQISNDQLLCVFDNLPPKKYRVTASLEGYNSSVAEAVVSVGKTLPLTLKISPTESFERIVAQTGRFYALIIGNNNYQYLPELQTAVADAEEVNSILQARYGFQTRLLIKREQRTDHGGAL